jgi:hypothetical protein
MTLVLLLAAVAVTKFGWLLAAFAVAAVFGRVVGGWLARRDDAAATRRRRDAELRARADRQHAAVLAGDDRLGVYGDNPPAMSASKILASVAVTGETGPNTKTDDCRAHRRSIPRANALTATS